MRRHRYRAIRYGAETLAPGLVLPRHRHVDGYATVVLDGGLVEASFAGRFCARAGDVLLHAAFDCHSNWGAGLSRLRILRLPWRDDREGHFRVADVDRLARLGERDPEGAAEALAAMLVAPTSRALDWPELLAAAMTRDPSLALGDWALAHGLAPETISRGFKRAFGVAPQRFRLEVRARRAWRALSRCDRSLTAIAHEHDFADLAHMSRSISAFTGVAPSAWRQVRSSVR